MAHEFTFLIDKKLVTFTEWEDIPEKFDHVIRFLPDVPHEEVDHSDGAPAGGIWSDRLHKLVEKERKNARSN